LLSRKDRGETYKKKQPPPCPSFPGDWSSKRDGRYASSALHHYFPSPVSCTLLSFPKLPHLRNPLPSLYVLHYHLRIPHFAQAHCCAQRSPVTQGQNYRHRHTTRPSRLSSPANDRAHQTDQRLSRPRVPSQGQHRANFENRQALSFDPHSREVPSSQFVDPRCLPRTDSAWSEKSNVGSIGQQC